MTERKLHKIGYLTKELGITARTLRYYEQLGLLPHVKRSDGKMRLYTDEDVELIQTIRRLQKDQFLPLEEIKERLFGSEDSEQGVQTQHVVTDSSVVLGNDVANLPIDRVPFTFMFGSKKVVDDNKFSVSQLWDLRQKTQKPPITVAPSVDLFKKKYLALHRRGVETIYSVHVSSDISKTIDNAREAAALVRNSVEVHVVDTHSLGCGIGVLVQQIASAIYSGNTPAMVQSLLAKQARSIGQFVLVGDLNYLVEGGILPFSGDVNSPLLKSLFAFKPLFRLDPENPDLTVTDCFKTTEDGVLALQTILSEEIANRARVVDRILIGYTYLHEEAKQLSNWLHDLFPQTPCDVAMAPPVVSTYLGPETLSVSIL